MSVQIVLKYINHYSVMKEFLRAISLLFCVGIGFRTFAQTKIVSEVDSCKVFVVKFFSAYRMRVYPEHLMYDANDTSFIIDKNKQSRLLDTFNAFRDYAQENQMAIQNLNKNSIDYRLVFQIFRAGKVNLIGFGTNGLMAFDNKVYRYKKEILYSLMTIIPELEGALHL